MPSKNNNNVKKSSLVPKDNKHLVNNREAGAETANRFKLMAVADILQTQQ